MTRRRRFPAIATSVGDARRFVAEALPDDLADATDDVALMVSELASNAIRHGLTAFDLTLHRDAGEFLVEVTDYGDGIPAMCQPDPGSAHGRGLRIVDTLANRWGVSGGPGSGKTVWFALAVADAASGSGVTSDATAG